MPSILPKAQLIIAGILEDMKTAIPIIAEELNVDKDKATALLLSFIIDEFTGEKDDTSTNST